MAALDDSPSRCQGQPWTVWADRMGFSEKPGENQEEDAGKNGREGDAMKLRKEDMALFGFCPAQDDFYLVVCGVCEQVVKPQALQSHMELRHREDAQRSQKGSSQKQHVETQQSTGAPAPSSQPPEKDHPSPKEAVANSSTCSPSASTSSSSVPPQTNSGGNNTRAKNPVLNAQLARGSTSSTRTLSQGSPQVCAQQQQQHHQQQQQHGRKANGNHPSNPVVRVERMPHSLMPKKERGQKREVPSPEQPPPDSGTTQAVALSQGVTAGTILANGNHVLQQAIVAVAAAKKAAAAGVEGRTRPASKSKSKTPSERKLLPCKDRVYDANKHCGVWIADIAKQCTRSLTCKTHSLAMRRNVSGRKKNFDELLADHRAAKEAEAAAKAAQVIVLSGLDTASAPCPLPTATIGPVVTHVNPNSKKCGLDAKRPNCPATEDTVSSSSSRRKQSFSSGSQSKAVCLAPLNNHKLLPSSSSSSAKSKVANSGNKSALTPSTQLRPSQVNANSTPAQEPVPKMAPLDAGVSCVTVDQTAVTQPQQRKDRCFVMHHPRPAAVCTFNARQMGAGFFVCDRRLDATRTALRAALGERHPLTPPIKKLCVESRLPPVPEPSDPSDPYSFTCNDHVTAAKCSPAAVTVRPQAPLPPPRPASLPVPLLATCPPVPLTFGSPTQHHHRTAPSSSSSPSIPTCPSPKPVKKVAPAKTRTNREAPLSSGPKRKRTCDSAPTRPGPTLVSQATTSSPNSNNVLSVSFPVNLPGMLPIPPARTQHSGPFGDVNLLVTNVGVVNGQLMTPQSKAMAGFGCRQNRQGHGGFPSGTTTTVSALLTGPRKGKGASSRSRTGPRMGPGAVTMAVLGGGMGALSNVGLVSGVTHTNNHVTQVSPSSAKSPSAVTRSGCVSPQVLTNGLGPSPPPPQVFLKGTQYYNHVNRTGSPDLPSPSSEGKTCGSRQDGVAAAASKGPQGSPRMAPRLGSQVQTQSASVNASVVTIDGPASTARSHVYSGIRQGSNAVNHHSHQQAANRRTTSRPIPTKMVSGSSSPMQLLAKPFLLQNNEDMRRQEMHGSQSLPT